MPKQISPKIVAFAFGILVISFLIAFYAVAWQEPASTPPAGNVPAPLNVGSAEQIKTGNLVVNALGVSATGNALIVANGNVGIGTASPGVGVKLDVQGGDVKIGTGIIKGDGSVSTNLNADKLDGKHADELPGLRAMWVFSTSCGVPYRVYSDSSCANLLGYSLGGGSAELVNANNNSIVRGTGGYVDRYCGWGGCDLIYQSDLNWSNCATGLSLDYAYGNYTLYVACAK